jgi:hypothetical protein
MKGKSGNLVQVSLPRAGLGHALNSYARAYCYFAEGAAEFVHPIWFKLRIGPYLRRERDKRNYHRIIQTPADWGLHWRHGLRRLGMRVVGEDDFDRDGDEQFLVVRDDGPFHARTLGTFERVYRHRESLVQSLESISRFPVEAPASDRGPTIGIFHRSGDMKALRPSTSDPRALRTHGYGYYPPEYASEALRKVREIAGWQVPAVLSTDAELGEVAPILREGAVSISQSRSALANMLEMRHHQLLIVGTSMYSKWAWLLGDAFAVIPRYKDEVVNLIHIPERPFAWFVFPQETSLNDAVVGQEVARRLRR